ncbi:hypothetical protein ZWY2020_017832 [Hordeum vulgare]|nr:hypothetical protein ZWY2020_017832 [Hordeum vulgare]
MDFHPSSRPWSPLTASNCALFALDSGPVLAPAPPLASTSASGAPLPPPPATIPVGFQPRTLRPTAPIPVGLVVPDASPEGLCTGTMQGLLAFSSIATVTVLADLAPVASTLGSGNGLLLIGQPRLKSIVVRLPAVGMHADGHPDAARVADGVSRSVCSMRASPVVDVAAPSSPLRTHPKLGVVRDAALAVGEGDSSPASDPGGWIEVWGLRDVQMLLRATGLWRSNSARWPAGIDPRGNDPMLEEAMAPSPQVLPAIIGLLDCSDWGGNMGLTDGASSEGSEESVDPMCLEATLWSPHLRGSSSFFVVHSLVHPMPNPEESLSFNEPDILVEPVIEVCNVVTKVAQTKATPLSLEDFLTKVTCPLPQALHVEKNDGQRSERMDKKNKARNIPTSKRAEYRMLAAFGGLPEDSKAVGPEQKMQAYLDMYKKPLSPQVIEALSSLARIAGKSFDMNGFPSASDGQFGCT